MHSRNFSPLYWLIPDKNKKLGVYVLKVSPPYRMMQVSDWCQNIGNTCRDNLRQRDFSKRFFLPLVEAFLKNIRKSWGDSIEKNLVFSKIKTKIENRARLSCRAQFFLQLKTSLCFLAHKMAEKSLTEVQ